jgi:hypothetical protein
MARWIIIAGVVLVFLGGILHFAPWLFNWFGKLPGDIHIETECSSVFIPLSSMILISVGLTVLINLVAGLMR